MNIVKLSNDLGNQMFQYAFYLALKARNGNVGIDISELLNRKNFHKFGLGDVFCISPRIIRPEELALFADTSKGFFANLRRFLFGKKKVHGSIYKEKGCEYDASVWEKDNTYFEGFWQSAKYFDKVDKEVREQFQYDSPLTEVDKAIADAASSCESVAIHVCRGSSKNKKYWKEVGSVCTKDYYGWAIASMRQQLGENIHFFIFSEEPVKDEFNMPNTTFIDWYKGEESYNNLRLMSLCKHNIIANNAISWWAAYLNENPDKIVIAPKKWYRTIPAPDIYPADWIQVAID